MTTIFRSLRILSLLTIVGGPLAAQVPSPLTFGDGRRAQATRQELEAALAEIEQVIASRGYSSRIREARLQEAELIRERLAEGDIQVGDQITLTVLDQPQFTGTFLIGPGRVLSLPGIPDISMRGVLRAEAQVHLTEQLRRQLRDPRVQVQTFIRLTISGTVARPGFYQVPADVMPTDAIMAAAGGFAGNSDPNRTTVRRQGREIWSRESFQDAVIRGMTLDQMNLRTGDEILVKAPPGRALPTVLSVVGGAASLTFLLSRVF